MKTLEDVIAWLEEEGQAVFDAGVFHQDEYGTFSATACDAAYYEEAAEVLRDLLPRDDDA